MLELAGLFVAAFAAATLIPLSSEAALYAYLHFNPERTAAALTVATVGNTAGGMTSYLIGRLVPQKKLDHRAIRWLQRHGAPATLLAWLPIIGDGIAVAAGWLRIRWWAALAFMAAGRLARYLAVAVIL